VVALGALLALCVVAAVFVQVVFDAFKVPSSSMRPALQPGDRVLAWSFARPEAQRGDIVIFEPPRDSAMDPRIPSLVGRVVGVGGDRLGAVEGRVTLNGEPLHEPYLSARTTTESLGPTVVPDGSLYVLGDNREHAADSRVYGTVPEGDVLATVTFTNVPLEVAR